MEFYHEWKKNKDNTLISLDYAEKFLASHSESTIPFFQGSEDEIRVIVQFLKDEPIDIFFEVIKKKDFEEKIPPHLYPCFSNFYNGATRLNEILEFSPNGSNFVEIGYMLMESETQLARMKYGENHSKLAEVMSLVEIRPTRPAIVKNTALGKYLAYIPIQDKENVLKKLLLRNVVIQRIIRDAMQNQASYKNIAVNLKKSTAYRRRTSIKYLIEFILQGTSFEYLVSQIDWQV